MNGEKVAERKEQQDIKFPLAKESPQQAIARLLLEEIAGKVKQLSLNEAKEKFKDVPPTSRVESTKDELTYEILNRNLDFEINGRYFRVEYSKPLDIKLLKAVVYQLNVAVDELSKIAGYNEEVFLIRIRSIGDRRQPPAFGLEYESEREALPIISIPLDYGGGGDFVSLALSFESGNYQEVSRAFRASLRHELIHRFRDRIGEAMDWELLPLFGDFLYDPNASGREESIRNIEHISKKTKYEKQEYTLYRADAFKLLLWEYGRLNPDFKVPALEEEQVKLIKQLPSLYDKVSPEQRDEILKKYLMLPDKDIMQRLAGITMQLDLKF